MEMPQHDNQDPEQNISKTPRRSARPGTSKRRQLVYRYGILTVVCLVLAALVGFIVVDVVGGMSHVNVQSRPISDILNMADQHLLKSVTINGNTITAIGKNGQHYHAIKEDGQSVTEAFRKDGVSVSVDGGQDNGLVPILIDVLFVGAAIGLLYFVIRRTGMGGATAFSRARARRFQETRPAVLFKDVAGVDEAKQELSEIVEFLKDPERFVAMGARIPRGVLLVGAPGTGKTLISRAVAGEANVSFYSINGSEFVEMFVGVGAARVRDLFKEAREHAPCIVFIDEIDAVGRQRNAASVNGNDEREQTLNQLLVEMDGFDKQTNIVVIAATNRPDVLDPALLRPGRFDRQVMLDKPDIRGRLAILEVHAKDKPLVPDVTLADLARQTVGFSGADLANLLNEAALLAARNHRTLIEKPDLDEAILRVLAGPERKSRLITEDEKAIIAYHEVGHAIVMRSIPGSDPVQKVTAIARGMALGITVSAPAEDRYLLRRSELLAKMAGLMGGRAAEEIVFGDITTGASQDIEQATNIARRMVCEFGMSPLGLIALKNDAEGSPTVSSETAAKIDHEVALLVEQAYQTALEILRAKREKLSLIAEHLIDVETIEGGELDAMLFAS
jgi:cell division protease FtsH